MNHLKNTLQRVPFLLTGILRRSRTLTKNSPNLNLSFIREAQKRICSCNFMPSHSINLNPKKYCQTTMPTSNLVNRCSSQSIPKKPNPSRNLANSQQTVNKKAPSTIRLSSTRSKHPRNRNIQFTVPSKQPPL